MEMPPPTRYRRVIRQGDVFVVNSEFESSCIGFIEQVLIGQVGVVRQKPWVSDLIPESYPFVVESDSELVDVTF